MFFRGALLLFSFRPVFLQIVFFSALSASCPSVLPCFAFVPFVLYLFARLPAYVSRDPPAALFVLILHPPYTRARVAQISGVSLDGFRVAFRLGGACGQYVPLPCCRGRSSRCTPCPLVAGCTGAICSRLPRVPACCRPSAAVRHALQVSLSASLLLCSSSLCFPLPVSSSPGSCPGLSLSVIILQPLPVSLFPSAAAAVVALPGVPCNPCR